MRQEIHRIASSMIRNKKTLIVFALAFVIAGCNFPGSEISATSTQSPVVNSFTPTIDEAASPETIKRKVLLFAKKDFNDPGIIEFRDEVVDLAYQSGLGLENLTTMQENDFQSDVTLVFLLEADPGVAELASGHPDVQFVIVGLPGIAASNNISVLDTQDRRPDHQAFVAGFIAAMVADDWRAGVVSIGSGAENEAIQTGFINGARYFCGLCRPAFPPFYEYPQSFQLDTGGEDWGSLAALIQENRLGVIYLAPLEVFQSNVQEDLQLNIAIIGDGARPDAVPESQWLATIRYSAINSLRTVWEDLLGGRGGLTLHWELKIIDVNRDLLSEGRERAARGLIDDMEAGFVDTGYEPTN